MPNNLIYLAMYNLVNNRESARQLPMLFTDFGIFSVYANSLLAV